ncbi:MAG: HypC/HybG/HupF family hydrogenase formation chaperone [Anaerolineae bacterium]|nr:HypC/HybG/HupF family hydrogenase formation chaperone [Anaerolineae bacterium]MCA9892829.1 HypC/HybG/HupF family hydrogenase formation chaperone [Anaerolineae bacterium]
MCLAIPGRITEIYEVAGLQMGKIDFGGITKEACLAYLENPQVGDYTMIHVGFAISKVDEEEAFRTLELLREMGELDEELGIDVQVTSPESANTQTPDTTNKS